MSIQSEIDRINDNVASTYTALSEMGATMPAQQNSDNLPGTVRTVPQGGGTSVQTDWNQTDETAPDFLKNKPFGDVLVDILEEQELPFDEEGGALVGMTTHQIMGDAELIVVIDGVSYETKSIYYGDQILFGNLSIMGLGHDTGEPFIGMYQTGRLAIVLGDTASHTVKITGNVIVKLPEKYYDGQTVFYVVSGNKYVYIDKECTIKATMKDVSKSMQRSSILIKLNDFTLLQVVGVVPASVHKANTNGLVLTAGYYSTAFQTFFTAEYTE